MRFSFVFMMLFSHNTLFSIVLSLMHGCISYGKYFTLLNYAMHSVIYGSKNNVQSAIVRLHLHNVNPFVPYHSLLIWYIKCISNVIINSRMLFGGGGGIREQKRTKAAKRKIRFEPYYNGPKRNGWCVHEMFNDEIITDADQVLEAYK